ncbi:MAG: TolC family outer membrane protein [Burkholderiaceae bacterium]
MKLLRPSAASVPARRHSGLRLRALALALGAAWLPATSQAQNLVELFDAARGFDASFQSARAQYDASVARAAQSRAGILPSANLSAGVSRSQFENNNPPIDRISGSQNATLSASQPLYRPANRLAYDQGKKSVDVAKAVLQAAEQDLVVRVSQAYFDVLGAQDTLAFVRAQKAAVAEQLASAKRNFEVGTSTITDAREAQARFDLVIAQEIAAENDVRIRRIALDTLVGRNDAAPRPLALPVALPPLQPGDVAVWVQESESNSPAIAQAALALEIAQLETRRARAGHLPTLDLNASYNVTKSQNGSVQTGSSFTTSTGATDSRTNNASISLAFNLPLFAGFATQNRIRETLALEERAESDLNLSKRSVGQTTRTAFFGVVSGLSQVNALEASEQSSQLALDANKLGYQVGVRINIDVLNAQSQLFQTKRDLAQARYNVLLGGLRLRQAAGTLTAQDLLGINALLVR